MKIKFVFAVLLVVLISLAAIVSCMKNQEDGWIRPRQGPATPFVTDMDTRAV